jgi:hypothetical protein
MQHPSVDISAIFDDNFSESNKIKFAHELSLLMKSLWQRNVISSPIDHESFAIEATVNCEITPIKNDLEYAQERIKNVFTKDKIQEIRDKKLYRVSFFSNGRTIDTTYGEIVNRHVNRPTPSYGTGSGSKAEITSR